MKKSPQAYLQTSGKKKTEIKETIFSETKNELEKHKQTKTQQVTSQEKQKVKQ